LAGLAAQYGDLGFLNVVLSHEHDRSDELPSDEPSLLSHRAIPPGAKCVLQTAIHSWVVLLFNRDGCFLAGILWTFSPTLSEQTLSSVFEHDRTDSDFHFADIVYGQTLYNPGIRFNE
jgi:hypothetical protein